MSVPRIANIDPHRRPAKCGHPLDHLPRGDIWATDDGGVACEHGGVPEHDRRWTEKRNEMVCDYFKEAIGIIGRHGLAALWDPPEEKAA